VASIINSSAKNIRQIKLSISSFAAKKSGILAKGLNASAAAAELLTDPLFQSIVKAGVPAVAHIIEAHEKDKESDRGIWEEMLKQIHAIEKLGGGSAHEEQKFEQWLTTFLASESTATAPTEPETPASPTEPAPEDAPSTPIASNAPVTDATPADPTVAGQ